MRSAVQPRAQEQLPTDGAFLLADAQADGFPVRYVSPGFEQLYGYKAAELAGRKCGDVVGGSCILANSSILASTAAALGHTLKETEARTRFLVAKAGEACRAMMAQPGDGVGFTLLLNRRKAGPVFVCELLLLSLRHPSLNWAYCAGFQRDVSREVPPQALFAACTPSAYERLLQSRAAALGERRAALLGPALKQLHERALGAFAQELWGALRCELMAPNKAEPVPRHKLVPQQLQQQRLLQQPKQHQQQTPQQQRQLQMLPQRQLVRPQQPQQLQLQRREQRGKEQEVQPEPQQELQQELQQEHLGLLQLLRPSGPGGLLSNEDPQSDPYWHLKRQNSAVAFLAEAGLYQYTEQLLLNGFDDLETLLEIEDEDIKELGFTRGHAAKLKKRLRDFKRLHGLGSEHSTARSEAGSNSWVPVANTDAKMAAKQSWEHVQALGVEHVGEATLRKFFEIAPEAETLFANTEEDGNVALGRIAAKMLKVVGTIAAADEQDTQRLVPALAQMGARHGGYGAREEHFPRMAAALHATLRNVLGEELYTREVRGTWDIAFGFASAAMMGGLGAAELAAAT